MDKRIIEAKPEIYEKAKPYIDFLESLGFYQDRSMTYFNPEDEDVYEFFNHWHYKKSNKKYDDDYVCDLVSYTGELKVEVYTFKMVKRKDYDGTSKLIYNNENQFGDFDSVIVNDLPSFKKEISKYLKGLKAFKSKVRKNEMEGDFTEADT